MTRTQAVAGVLAVWVAHGCMGSGPAGDSSVDVHERPSHATHGRAPTSTETIPTVVSRSAADWWNRAIEAAGESVAGIRAAMLQRGLGDMPRVAETLGNRRGGFAPEVLFPRIPAGVRLAGEEAVVDYLSERDLSHIRSVRGAPELATEPENVIFERATANRARGARHMTNWEWMAATADNAVAGMSAGARVIAKSMVRGVAYGAVLDLPVSATVETLHVLNQRKSAGEAAQNAALDAAGAGAAGLAGAGVLTAVGAAGFTVGTPVLVPLAIVGGTAYVWVSSDRIVRALDEESRTAVEAHLTIMQDMIRDHVTTIGDGAGSAIESLQETLESALAPVN